MTCWRPTALVSLVLMMACPGWARTIHNYGVPADVYVDNSPGDFLAGLDAQVEKAVEVVQEELRKNPPKDVPGR